MGKIGYIYSVVTRFFSGDITPEIALELIRKELEIE